MMELKRNLPFGCIAESARKTLVQSLNSPFFPPHIGVEPGRATGFNPSIWGGKKGEFRDWTRKTYLQRKRRYLQARRVHGFPDSIVLFNLICIEVDVLTLYLSFEIREKMNRILYFIASIPLKSLLLSSGSDIVSCFSAWAEIPF